MDDGYLPEYYIRKKQRDRMYTNVWYGVGLVVVVFLAFLAGSFAFRTVGVAWKNRGKPAVNTEHADELNELKTEQKIADAMKEQQKLPMTELGLDPASQSTAPGELSSVDAAAAEAAAGADLGKLDYAESFPLVTVALSGGSQPAKSSETDAAKAQDSTKKEDTQPSTDSTSVKTDVKKDEKASDKPAQKPADPDTDESKPVLSNSLYHVYVAEVNSKDAANDVVGKLAEHGYSGSIIEQKPNFLIKVMQTSKSEEAVALVNKLKQLGFDPFITRSARK